MRKVKRFCSAVALVEASIMTEAGAKQVMAESAGHFEPIDILVNNVGGLWMEQDFGGIDAAHFDQAIRSDIDGTVYCIREVLPMMRQRRWGRIINICVDREVVGHVLARDYVHPLDRFPYDYVLAKEAKANVAHLLAIRELKFGITINNVLPGVIEEVSNDEAIGRIFGGGQLVDPIRFDPIDVGLAVVNLCSPAARGVTGGDVRLPGNIYRTDR